MNIFKYDSYEHYVESQSKKTVKKFNKVWVKDSIVEFVSKFVRDNIPNAKFGICHGVRNGAEVKKFNEILTECHVIGTELVNVKPVKNVIIHDFHDVKDEWVGAVDFIYSNAFDHSYDPEMCIKKWMSCIKTGGMCFIEWTKNDTKVNDIDCFGANREEYLELLSGEFSAKAIPMGGMRKTTLFIVTHK